ncbi:uncharacterized protein FPRO_05438 [Fusarium proliferatum ET1]|uniref:Uncharacterized protein n=1 Tax=Fusarium proliferatum (strain ET1) TaxID=1227346 RepID=A0A1L7VIX8_FUSPR|nr:uncharacterized protein FPRO_05438 [Fusarium proliferatum ET1]CZR40538.1 uncharacterized protein FPRO_05438 [Fusarium proliferatum ET1]
MQRLKRLLQRKRPKRDEVQRDEQSPAQVPLPTPVVTDSPKTPSLSDLERLPFEIRNGFLLAIDSITDLSALVHASPTFHEQYRLDRAFWLWHCLQLEMGHVFVDAYIANQCNSPEFRLKRNRERVLLFIEDYKSHRSMITEVLTKCPDEDEMLSIAAFHSSVIRPLMNHYVSWAHGNMELLSTPKDISRTEERRIMRGFYRFQIFSNLFGAVKDVDHGESFLGSEERLSLFLADFMAWEIEEMLCINAFVQAKYESVFQAIQWDLHPDNPSFDSSRTGPHTPPGAFHLANHMSSEWYRNGMVSRGLCVLSSVFKAQGHLKLVEVVSEEIVAVVDDLLFRSTLSYYQEARRENQHSDRDQAQDDREKMVFSRDSDGSPPLAWVIFWKETYSNLFGDFIPQSLRQWGYVMWDSDRLVNTDAVARLDQAWKDMYTEPVHYEAPGDPRDEMLAYH